MSKGDAMNILKFLVQYMSKPRTTGAVLPSSKYLAKKMVKNMDFANANCIVEYGAGTGVFTGYLVDQKKPETILIVFEKNPDFYQLLLQYYGNAENVHITNDSATEVGMHLKKYKQKKADYILSGLPFASLPKNMSENILTKTKKHLSEKGELILFQYTLIKMELLKKYFTEIKIEREWRNVPPAYVLRCKI